MARAAAVSDRGSVAPPGPIIDPDKIDAMIAAARSPVMPVTSEFLAAVSREIRLGNVARFAMEGVGG